MSSAASNRALSQEMKVSWKAWFVVLLVWPFVLAGIPLLLMWADKW